MELLANNSMSIASTKEGEEKDNDEVEIGELTILHESCGAYA
jgi:hypothetical protein